jgi:hypothetical protein
MRSLFKSFAFCAIATFSPLVLNAQDLTPHAYVITPVHANAVVLSYSYSSGDIIFGSTFPITGASGTINLSTISYYHALGFQGRSANITVSLPYTTANFRGEVAGSNATAYRSGLTDLVLRFSVNIKGGPAMPVEQFLRWRQKTIVGASLKIIAPTGQYDPAKLINPGANRWAFKPEIGISRRKGHWLVDGYMSVWLFTTNHDYLSRSQNSSGTHTLSQAPMGALETHLSYDVRPRLWASLDANFWYGGRTSTDGIVSRPTLQANSRIGATCSVPVSKHQSLKFSYSHGARIRFGGNSNNVSVAWQYSWLGKPR